MAMDLGDAKITIKAKDEASAKMQKIGRSTDGMSRKFKMAGIAIAAMGVVMVAALGKIVMAYAAAGDEVAKMAKRTGWGVEALSEMRHVAKIAGTTIGSLEKATKKMSKAILDADRGLETYARAFRELGLDIEYIKRLKPEDQFWAIAYALGALEDEFIQVGLAQDIFGRAGTELLPMLAMGEDAIEEERQVAHDLGVVFTEETAQGAEDFNDAVTRLKGALQGLVFAIATQVMPELEELADTLTEKLKPAIAWLSEHPEVTEAFVKFGTVIGGVMVVGMLSKFISAVTAIIALFAAWNAWILTLEENVKKFMVVFAPLAAVIFGVGKLIDIFQGVTPEMREWIEKHPEVIEPRRPVRPMPIPSMQYGGIVPGPIGQPVPIIAHGGEPFGGVGRAGMTVKNEWHLNIGNFMGDELSFRQFARKLQEVFREEERRTAFSGVNTGYFYGGSHI